MITQKRMNRLPGYKNKKMKEGLNKKKERNMMKSCPRSFKILN